MKPNVIFTLNLGNLCNTASVLLHCHSYHRLSFGCRCRPWHLTNSVHFSSSCTTLTMFIYIVNLYINRFNVFRLINLAHYLEHICYLLCFAQAYLIRYICTCIRVLRLNHWLLDWLICLVSLQQKLSKFVVCCKPAWTVIYLCQKICAKLCRRLRLLVHEHMNLHVSIYLIWPLWDVAALRISTK